MPATPNAGRKKVRCPKCTALFSERSKAIFECPICSCRLSANGAVVSTVSNQAKEKEFEQTKAANGVHEGSRVHSQEGLPSDGSDVSQGTPNQLCEENRGPSPTLICKEEQQPSTQNGDLSAVSDNNGKDGILSEEDIVEDLYANSDNTAEDSSLKESKPAVVKNEVMEGEDSVEKIGASNKHLQLQMFQTTRCEFSFKYSLEGASPVEKRLPPKLLSSEKTELNNEASDIPVHVPLRVRISNTREESSDQSEHGRYSFGSDTDSHNGSESEFDFPAPWADGLQNKVLPLPDSLVQTELFQHHPKQAVAAAPHQLELLDVDDARANEEYALQESSKHYAGSIEELPLQVGDAGKATSYSGREDDVATSSFNQVNDLASMVSSVTLSEKQSLVESSAAVISSNQQDTQFASSLHNVSSVNEESVHTYAEPDARNNNMSDPLLLQDTEMELDLYSHPKVDEWQPEEAVDSPSRARYYSPTMENESLYSELQPMEGHPSSFSEYAVSSTPRANVRPYVSDHLSFGASKSNQIYTYQVPPQILPPTFQNQAIAPFTYHTVPNACMLCSHHQHPYMQTHLGPHCAVCVGHSGPLACTSGHADHWSYNKAHHSPAPAFASSILASTSRPMISTQQYDFPGANLRLQASLPGKPSQYPPLPKDGAAPYFACKGCDRVLQVPLDLPPNKGLVQKLRCSACCRITKFSAKQRSRQRQVVSSLPAMERASIGGAAYALPGVQYNAGGSISSHDQNVVLRSSWQHDEGFSKLIDTDLFTSRVSTMNSQGTDYLRGQPRDHDVDSSIKAGPSYSEETSSMTGIMSAQYKLTPTDSVGLARTRQDAAPSVPPPVEEKDEGLDFGAPRSSDGDSLDQSDSRMRSPEDIQPQRNFAGVPEDGPLGDFQAPGQMPKRDWRVANKGQKPGSPLLVLLNQESTRFRLSLDPRAPTEESESASSPASGSPLVDSSQNRLWRKRRNSSESRKGPKYIAGLLRRSLRDFSKGGH